MQKKNYIQLIVGALVGTLVFPYLTWKMIETERNDIARSDEVLLPGKHRIELPPQLLEPYMFLLQDHTEKYSMNDLRTLNCTARRLVDNKELDVENQFTVWDGFNTGFLGTKYLFAIVYEMETNDESREIEIDCKSENFKENELVVKIKSAECGNSDGSMLFYLFAVPGCVLTPILLFVSIILQTLKTIRNKTND